jgi:putative ABC transport system ATP-binding protein
VAGLRRLAGVAVRARREWGRVGCVRGIVLEQIGVSYGEKAVFTDITAALPSGRCTAIVGPSGVGKTTLLRLLNRLAEPSSGRILLDGVPIAELDVLELRRRVGLIPQRPTLVEEIVVDEVRMGRRGLTDAEVLALLARAGLPESFLHRQCRELSGGEAQRVCLARGLAVRPQVLVLDEPTSALDEVAAAAVGKLIGEHTGAGGGVVLVSHDSTFVGTVADDILLLDDGRLARLGEFGERGLAPRAAASDAAEGKGAGARAAVIGAAAIAPEEFEADGIRTTAHEAGAPASEDREA